MYGVNEKCTEPVCIYLYKGSMSAEVILINNTEKKANIEIATVMLNLKTETIQKKILNPHQEITLIKEKYNDPYKETSFNKIALLYKLIDEPKKDEKTSEEGSSEEKKQNMEIEVH